MVDLKNKSEYYSKLQVASPRESKEFERGWRNWTEAITRWRTREEEKTRS